MSKRLLAIISLLVVSTAACQQSESKVRQPHNDLIEVVVPELPDTLSFAGERVPLENYDTRESLEREIQSIIYTHSKTSLMFLQTDRIFSVIAPILAQNGVPDDFRYLCVAESSLDVNAVSSAKAAGLWQFMSATATKYGLKVGGEVDQRYHVEMATDAACRLLKESYELFGSWTLAAAAYNLGETGVMKRIDNQQVKSYYDAYFPQETMRYIFRILAYKVIMENPAAYGYDIDSYRMHKRMDQYDEVQVWDKNIDWAAFAIANGTTYKLMREYNQWIRDYSYDNKNSDTLTVRIPKPNSRTERH